MFMQESVKVRDHHIVEVVCMNMSLRLMRAPYQSTRYYVSGDIARMVYMISTSA